MVDKQDGEFGIGEMKGGEIKDNAKVGGVINDKSTVSISSNNSLFLAVCIVIFAISIAAMFIHKNRPDFYKSNKTQQEGIAKKLLHNEKYTDLQKLLRGKQFNEADEATWNILLEITERKKEESLGLQDVQNFPCEDLAIIDKLWVEYKTSCKSLIEGLEMDKL